MTPENWIRYNTYLSSGLFGIKQMTEIYLGLAEGLDVSVYAKPENSADSMKLERLKLADKRV